MTYGSIRPQLYTNQDGQDSLLRVTRGIQDQRAAVPYIPDSLLYLLRAEGLTPSSLHYHRSTSSHLLD